MPDRTFLSYTHPDADKVTALAERLRERGVRPWRDRDDLGAGTMTRTQIHTVLTDDCDGAVLWLSPYALESDYVMQVELPMIIELAETGGCLFTPIFDGLSPTDAADRVRERTGREIGGYNGLVAANYPDLDALVEDAASRHVTSVIHAARAYGDRPLLRAVTRDDTADAPRAAHIDLDWRHAYLAGVPDADRRHRLKHSLSDTVSAVLASYGPGAVQVNAKTHLSVAVALGHALREPTGAVPHVQIGDQRWAAQAHLVDEADRLIETLGSDGPVGARTVAVEVSVTRDVTRGVDLASANGAGPYLQRRRFTPPGGPARDAVTDEWLANAWAGQIVTGIDALSREYRAEEVHLFLACPLPLAVLIGWRLNACGPITIFEWADGTGPYVAGWTIP